MENFLTCMHHMAVLGQGLSEPHSGSPNIIHCVVVNICSTLAICKKLSQDHPIRGTDASAASNRGILTPVTITENRLSPSLGLLDTTVPLEHFENHILSKHLPILPCNSSFQWTMLEMNGAQDMSITYSKALEINETRCS